ncbi:MAG TPA: hypothetical protein VF670_10580 [Duganella sp.]|jgi:hypothetical protein
MSAGVLRDYAQLFPLQPGKTGSRRPLLRNTGIVVASGAALVWFAHAVMHSAEAGALFLCATVFLVLLLWCGGFAASAVRQNQPAYACLVPHLHRRLTTCCVALFVISSAALAFTISMAFDYRGYSLAFTGLLFPYLLLLQRSPLAFFLPFLCWAVPNLMPDAWVDPLAAPLLALGELPLWALCIAANVALMALILRFVLPRGGDRHFASRDRIDLLAKRGPEAVASRVRQQGDSWRMIYTRALRRDSVPSAPQGNQMLHALGASVHDGGFIVATIIIGAVAVAISVLRGTDLSVAAWLKTGDSVSMVLSLLLLLQLLSYTSGALLTLGACTNEQELYRLSPSAPAARQFNRVLATALLRRFARLWLVVLAGLVCVHFALTRSLPPSAYPLAQASLALPVACLLLRDYARMQNVARMGTSAFTMMAFIAASSAFSGIAARHPDFPWLVPAVVVAACSLFAVWIRWRAMMETPPAFPAGRLSR